MFFRVAERSITYNMDTYGDCDSGYCSCFCWTAAGLLQLLHFYNAGDGLILLLNLTLHHPRSCHQDSSVTSSEIQLYRVS